MLDGSIVALITPWNDKGQLDRSALETLIDFHNQSGTQGLVIAGSTGEGQLLTDAERKEIIQTAVEQSSAPVIVGCGAASTHETIKLGEQALSWGAQALLVVAPYYVKPSQAGITQHFHTVCEAWQKPVVAYNNPGRCAVDMLVSTVCDIAQNPYVVGLKDSSTDLARVQLIRASLSRSIALLAGEDTYASAYLQLGGDGWVSVVGNIAPVLCRQVCDRQGRDVPPQLDELMHALTMAGGNPVAVKKALSYVGKARHDVRLPLVSIEEKNERLYHAVRACG